jgi:ribosomal protein L11 methyltransferase
MTDAVSAFLAGLTGIGIEISSKGNGQTTTDHTFTTEKITAYIPVGPGELDQETAAKKIEELKLFLSKVRHIFPDCPVPDLLTETIIEEDWGKKWKSFFTSFQITPTLTIKPSWENIGEQEKEEETKRIVIEMDPGLAFGTGHHASTRLALLLLEELFLGRTMIPEKVLDVGTGSGILAMACGLYGAKDVLAIDNDPDAVETAKQNIVRNRLEGKITVSGDNISSIKPGFNLIVVNITHDILAELAKHLTSLLHPNGFLVLSGVLIDVQKHSIRELFTKLGLVYIKSKTEDEWAALQFQKT